MNEKKKGGFKKIITGIGKLIAKGFKAVGDNAKEADKLKVTYANHDTEKLKKILSSAGAFSPKGMAAGAILKERGVFETNS